MAASFILFGVIIFFGFCVMIIEAIGFEKFSILLGVIASIIGIAFILSGNTFVGILIIGSILLIRYIRYVKASNKKEEAAEKHRVDEIKRKAEQERRNFKMFYEQCEKAGIVTLSTESQKQRAILYAKQYGIKEQNIEMVIKQQMQLIEWGQKSELEKAAKAEADKKSEKYKMDAAEQQKMKTPYPYFGQEKRIAVWQEKLNKCNEFIAALDHDIDLLKNKRNTILSSKFLESKVDVATISGFGSAIGGTGAGVIAALDAMAENEKIEKENEKAVKRVTNYATLSITEQQRLEALRTEQLSIRWKCQSEIKAIELKLVDEIKVKNPLALLKIKNAEVTENSFKIELSLKKEAIIFGDIKAVIDGAFWAHIYQEKDYIGSVRVILPYEGVSNKTAKVSVDTSLGIDPSKDCYIEYEPETLWFIEP